LHDYFKWFVCCRDVGAEKPSKVIFDQAFELAEFWSPKIQREEILHIGDNFAADFCGARAAGFQALFLGRLYSFY
jgi:putative hydrolase of the HAD superfamily